MGGGKAVQGGTGTCHGRGGAPTAHFLGLNSHGVVIMISFFSLSSIIHVSFGKWNNWDKSQHGIIWTNAMLERPNMCYIFEKQVHGYQIWHLHVVTNGPPFNWSPLNAHSCKSCEQHNNLLTLYVGVKSIKDTLNWKWLVLGINITHNILGYTWYLLASFAYVVVCTSTWTVRP